MKTLVPLLAFALLLTGCDKVERTTQDLQQEKVLLELMQVQQDQLTALTQKERDLRALEKRSQDALQDIEQQRVALQTLQKKEVQESQVARDAIAREQAAVRAEREQVDAEKRLVQAAEARCRQLEHELADRRANLVRMQSAIQTNRRVDSVKRESDRRAAEAKLQAAVGRPGEATRTGVAIAGRTDGRTVGFRLGSRGFARRVAGLASAVQGR